MSDSTDKEVYLVYRSYNDYCNFWETVVSVHLDNTVAGLKALELQEKEGDEQTDFYVSTWKIED